MPFAVLCRLQHMPRRNLVLANAAEDFSGALCSPPYPICHMPCAICYALFLTGSDMCPFGSWSSLRCGGFLTGIMSSAKPSTNLQSTNLQSLISNVYSLSLLYAIRHWLYAVFADYSSRVTRHCTYYSPFAVL